MSIENLKKKASSTGDPPRAECQRMHRMQMTATAQHPTNPSQAERRELTRDGMSALAGMVTPGGTTLFSMSVCVLAVQVVVKERGVIVNSTCAHATASQDALPRCSLLFIQELVELPSGRSSCSQVWPAGDACISYRYLSFPEGLPWRSACGAISRKQLTSLCIFQ